MAIRIRPALETSGPFIRQLQQGIALSKLRQAQCDRAHHCNDGDGQCAKDDAQVKRQVFLK